MKVLIVEDDPLIVEAVSRRLRAEGFETAVVSRGPMALAEARRERPDLVLLDLSLPGKDGLDVCRDLRNDPVLAPTPVIMMTARVDEVDRIVGLELGADDYVTKPFSARELVLRVKAVLRRTHKVAAQAMLRAGAIVIYDGERRVQVNDRDVVLAPKEFDLLRALTAAHGRVLSREHLLRQVWGYEHTESMRTRTVDVHIRYLRQKLGTEAFRVETLKSVGYRLNPILDSAHQR